MKCSLQWHALQAGALHFLWQIPQHKHRILIFLAGLFKAQWLLVSCPLPSHGTPICYWMQYSWIESVLKLTDLRAFLRFILAKWPNGKKEMKLEIFLYTEYLSHRSTSVLLRTNRAIKRHIQLVHQAFLFIASSPISSWDSISTELVSLNFPPSLPQPQLMKYKQNLVIKTSNL